MIGCLSLSLINVSSEVEYCPDLVFFGLSVNFKSSNSTSPNCLGEETLNVFPEIYTISFSSLNSSSSNCLEKASKNLISILIPLFSISSRA